MDRIYVMSDNLSGQHAYQTRYPYFDFFSYPQVSYIYNGLGCLVLTGSEQYDVFFVLSMNEVQSSVHISSNTGDIEYFRANRVYALLVCYLSWSNP